MIGRKFGEGLLAITWLLAMCHFMVACSSNDDYDPNYRYEQRAKTQNETFNVVNNVLVGHWGGTMQQNTTTGVWHEVTNVWTQYTFRNDGTFTRLENGSTDDGNYKLYKNEEYPNDASGLVGAVHLSLEDITIPSTYSAWIDEDGYLRLDRVGTLGFVTSSSGIKYSKQ